MGSRLQQPPAASPAPSGIAKDLGTQLLRLRTLRGYSQAELAKRIGVQPNYISMVEHGRRCPRLELLTAWAAALGAALHLVETSPGQAPKGRAR